MNLQNKIVCNDCGVILNSPKTDYKHNYYCPRCNALVHRFGQKYELIIFISITSLILFFPSIFLPLLTLEILEIKQTTTLIETVFVFFDNGYIGVSIFITIIGLIIPFFLLVLILLIIIPLKYSSNSMKISQLFKFYKLLLEWQMAEVYLISIFIALIKLNKMATIEIGIGLYFFCTFLFLMILTIILFNPYAIWKKNEISDR